MTDLRSPRRSSSERPSSHICAPTPCYPRSCVLAAGLVRPCARRTPAMRGRSARRCGSGSSRTDLGSVPVPANGAQRLLADAARVLPDMVDVRRRIHRVPELGLDLPQTQAVVLEQLDGLDLDVRTGNAVTSVVADMQGGRDSGRVILLRADMDRL